MLENINLKCLDYLNIENLKLKSFNILTLTKYERDIFVAIEMWTCRNMKNISYKDHMTNQYVINQENEKSKILNTMLKRKKRANRKKERKKKATFNDATRY